MTNTVHSVAPRSAARRLVGGSFVAICSLVAGVGLVAPVPAHAAEAPPPLSASEPDSPMSTRSPSNGDALDQLHRIERLYRTTLNREPDLVGLSYWTNQLVNGLPPTAVAYSLLTSDEAAVKTSGDPISDAYRWALDREPDPVGYEYWRQQELSHAVLAISDSPEHIAATITAEPPAPIPPLPPAGTPESWVDAGHGVFVPPIMLRIRRCESHDNYQAANPASSARGAYQFLTGSWSDYGHAARYGVSRADLASPAQQDEAAVLTWQRSGTSPWNASRSCWG